MCVFLDSQIGMDKAPTVQSTIVESTDSIIIEVPQMDDISMPKSSVVHLEQACNNENQEINAPIAIAMQPTSKEIEKSTHEPLSVVATTSSSVDVEKSMLTIVLDINGLLLKRSPQPSSHHNSVQVDSKRYIILRLHRILEDYITKA